MKKFKKQIKVGCKCPGLNGLTYELKAVKKIFKEGGILIAHGLKK